MSEKLTKKAVAAWAYVERLNWPVFPCHSVRENGVCTCGNLACKDQGKHPWTEHGFKDASRDKGTIASWWSERPDANIAIPTGATSGFIAVDVDPRGGGTESLEDLEAEHGPLPHTVEAITGSGGRHILFKHPGFSVKNDNKGKVVAPQNSVE